MSLKSIFKGAGKVLGAAAPLVSLVPGVGTLAGAGIGAAGGLLSGGGLKGAVTGGALGAAGALGKAAKIGSGASVLKSVFDTAKKNPGLVLAGVNALQGARNSGKAADQRNQALNIARQDYDSRAPFRDMVMQRLQAPQAQAPNLSAIFRDPGNPYNRVS